MDLTTLARVKSILGIATLNTDEDAVIGALIDGLSREVEVRLLQPVQSGERTEVRTVKPHQRQLSLRAAPVDEAEDFTLKLSSTRDFSDATALSENVDFILEPEAGVVRWLSGTPATRHPVSGAVMQPGFAQVVYTAGMADDTADFVATYGDLSLALDLQIAYLFKRKASPGGNLQFAPAGTGTDYAEKAYSLLPPLVDAIDRYKRRML